MYIAEKIAEAISAIDTLPPSADAATRRCILDAVSAAVPGRGTAGGQSAESGAVAVWGNGSCPIWLTSARSTVIGAAFANSAFVCMLDIDDGHRAAAGHPGASIVPAVLTEVQNDPTLAPRAVTAIAIGYEVGLRIAAARDLRTLDTVNTGRWCGQGVAAAVGWLKRRSPRVIAEAMTAAGAVAPFMGFAEFTEVGNHVKEAIPHATANGLASLELAQAGFLAPLDLLDDSRAFDAHTLLDGLGDSWMIESCYFKPYSCCRWIHSAVDGLLKVMTEEKLSPQDVIGIRVETFERAAVGLNNQVAPKTLEAAQFSIPFCLGVLAIHGTEALVPMTNPALLNDPEVLSFASRVEVVLDAGMDSHFPAAVPSAVIVNCRDASYSETVMTPLGEPSNPMGWDALFEKFHALASTQLVSHQENSLRQALNDMRKGDLTALLTELSRPAVRPEKTKAHQG
ncbi:MmgE/PrpD family protein [Pseudarthrobacter sp. YAF2]|uniref:MmgE/PrpD family protein n=1 Tax=Pseudarthrobacter sp. YAF2 TaxID=3233078 RepID=UPI003F9562BF